MYQSEPSVAHALTRSLFPTILLFKLPALRRVGSRRTLRGGTVRACRMSPEPTWRYDAAVLCPDARVPSMNATSPLSMTSR